MPKTQTTRTTASNPDVAAAAAQFLSPIVLDLMALTVNGKQAHWHVRGANFIGVHELLDQIVANAQASADLAAERIVALGLPVDARLATVAAKTKATAVPAGFTKSDAMIADVIADMDAAIANVQAAIDGLGEIDQTSQDVAVEVMRGLEKDRWFLFAHIAE
ncbi:MAG TPA: DNA starvation/stationary phase protection protein [Microbacteriaceae bacterium]|jgi:starvation-inducible DNA-binding protein|nr:DNA starvation/stationary phase protection protein [Microbacteriaceae bacterium]HQX34839.1 DNA starvation/stationary phase protection protein [Microbacteriaceae bacterium]HQZ48054.1 DNA starvation/stationary phase protection protein [Microbacteriaceae bacterium]HRA08105.1 DNA starvation/stationary phase protection protein [Microbacteriaceae bacterium]